jgi:hypothetical protein
MITIPNEYSPEVQSQGAVLFADLDCLVGDHLTGAEKAQLRLHLLRRLSEMERAICTPRRFRVLANAS